MSSAQRKNTMTWQPLPRYSSSTSLQVHALMWFVNETLPQASLSVQIKQQQVLKLKLGFLIKDGKALKYLKDKRPNIKFRPIHSPLVMQVTLFMTSNAISALRKPIEKQKQCEKSSRIKTNPQTRYIRYTSLVSKKTGKTILV